MLPVNQILQGSALERLKELPDNSIDTCITSPPYWALRDYKVEGQLGSEPTFHQYLDDLIEIFAEVKRVIKPTGSIFVNIGDTYNGNKVGNTKKNGTDWYRNRHLEEISDFKKTVDKGIPEKSLCGIPERFAIRMTDELGLIRRNTVIWYKPNCMPSSASDRFTVDFEYIYFFTKSQRYHFETQYDELVLRDERVNNAVKMGWDPQTDYTNWYFNERQKVSWHDHTHDEEQGYGQQTRGQKPPQIHHPLGRQKRCVWHSSPDGGGGPVWKITTRAFSEAHFAVYPPQLIEPIIKAACPEWLCSACGKPRKLVYETKTVNTRPGIDVGNGKSGTDDNPNQGLHSSEWSKGKPKVVRMPKFGGNRASEYGNPTYSGKEWNPVTREPKKYTQEINCSVRERQDNNRDLITSKRAILTRRLKSMGSDDEGNYDGQSTKDYDSALAQDASETKRRILESYKRRANSDIVMTDCGCGSSFDNGICLDPFFGAGTTGLVALQLGRKFIGIELSKDYINIAMKRLKPYLDQSTLTEFVDQQ